MKLSASITLWLSLVFAVLCLAHGAYGWSAIEGMALGSERDNARGFAMFWCFLGAIGLACAAVSYWMTRRTDEA